MKVLNVVDGSGWTGGVEQTLLLAGELRRLGVDARIAANGENPICGEGRSRGIPVYEYENGMSRFAIAAHLYKLLGEGYDFVVGHKPGAIRHLIVPLILRRQHSRSLGVRRVSYPVSSLTVYRYPRHTVAVSTSVREVLISCGLSPRRLTVIPSGVDTSLFAPSEKMRSEQRKKLGLEGRKVILNLAKFVPRQKGQAHLFEAAAALKGRYPLTVLLAGLETDGEKARRAVKEAGLADTVRLLGFRRDIPELINAADLFVFPSLPGLDAIAGSVLQAMACGTIAVASAVGGIPEYLRDGENGFLVPSGDSPALEAAVDRAFGLGSAEREELTRRARETVLGGYSVRAMADQWMKLFGALGGGET